jgi:hypothetical protein
MEDLRNTWGEPYQYRTIKIYPVQMKYLHKFNEYINCILIEKNKFPDIRVIKMSYLRFIFEMSHAIDEKGKSLSYLYIHLKKLLIMVFRRKFHFVSDGKNIYIKIGRTLLNGKDFDNIRKIICKQNLVQIPELMDAEMEKCLVEAQSFLSKKEKPATTEENIYSFFVATGIDDEKIKNMTIYKFKKCMERLNLLKSWEIYTYPSLKSGENSKIKHWLCHIPEQKWYENLMISEEELNKKFSDKSIYQK